MSTSSTTDAQPPVVKKDNAVKVSLASMIGTVVESYDFFIYATASATYFGAVFFATDDPLVGALASFATLAIGFLSAIRASWPFLLAGLIFMLLITYVPQISLWLPSVLLGE